MTSKAITIGILFKVEVGNVNAGWTEGVVTVMKKVELPDGNSHPYISGQAMRRYMRDTMQDIITGTSEQMSPSDRVKDKRGKSPITTLGDPRKYIDDDLFGFMRAVKKDQKEKGKEKDEESEIGSTRKRTSPLRVSAAFGLFKFTGNRDLGTKSSIEHSGSAESGGSIFETEITNNIFKNNLILELDRVGVWKDYETTDEEGEGSLSEIQRKERIKIMIKSLKYLWGGGRQSRFLVDLTPQFIIYARMSKKVPIFLNSLNITYENSQYYLGSAIQEALKDYEQDVENVIIGSRDGFLKNVNNLENNGRAVQTIGNAIDMMIKDIDAAKI